MPDSLKSGASPGGSGSVMLASSWCAFQNTRRDDVLFVQDRDDSSPKNRYCETNKDDITPRENEKMFIYNIYSGAVTPPVVWSDRRNQSVKKCRRADRDR